MRDELPAHRNRLVLADAGLKYLGAVDRKNPDTQPELRGIAADALEAVNQCLRRQNAYPVNVNELQKWRTELLRCQSELNAGPRN